MPGTACKQSLDVSELRNKSTEAGQGRAPHALHGSYARLYMKASLMMQVNHWHVHVQLTMRLHLETGTAHLVVAEDDEAADRRASWTSATTPAVSARVSWKGICKHVSADQCRHRALLPSLKYAVMQSRVLHKYMQLRIAHPG